MSRAEPRTGRLPILTSLAGYQRRWVKRDVIAGLTLWAVLYPESLAYATIAGVSPVVGLYAAPGAARGVRRGCSVRVDACTEDVATASRSPSW